MFTRFQIAEAAGISPQAVSSRIIRLGIKPVNGGIPKEYSASDARRIQKQPKRGRPRGGGR